MRICAVLTGDLIGSSGLPDTSLQDARAKVIAATEELSKWSIGLLGSKPEFFRGDSWQVLLMDPGYFLRAAVFIRACLRAADENWDTRISVGIGGVTRVDKTRTSLSSGEAFLLSGHALDRMVSGAKIVVTTPEGAWPTLNSIALFSSELVDEWTSKQARVVSLALAPKPPLQSELAERLGITQQAVSKALTAAKLNAILSACNAVEKQNWKLVRFI